LSQTQDTYPILKLNKLSMEVLKKQRIVEIAAAPIQQKRASDDITALQPEEFGLFEHLRRLRKQLADEKWVPPYVIFPDTALYAMARKRPQSEAQFARISGVGSNKLEAYFTLFTSAIRDYCEAHNIVMGLELTYQKSEQKDQKRKEKAQPRATVGPPTRQVTLDMYQEGKTIEQIAQERTLAVATIMGHLADLFEAGEEIDIAALIPPGHYHIIIDTLKQMEGSALKDVKAALGDDFSYGEIRLALAMIRRM
jgi:ATP-dependent DNA helicase RecQ